MEKRYLSSSDIRNLLLNIVRQIEQENWTPEKIIGISRGGLVPATMLSHWYNVPLHCYHLSTRDHARSDLLENQLVSAVQGKRVLIVEDICDTGETFSRLESSIEHFNCSVRWACMVYNIGQAKFTPHYYGEEINKMEKDTWISFPWEEWWLS